MIKLAIIGTGRWGMNHLKTSVLLLEPSDITVCDANPKTREKISAINENIKFTTEISDILNDPKINACIISTPAETHYEIAKNCLNAKKNCLVEKPITLYSYEAEELLAISQKFNLKLMVGHVLLYHPALQKIKEEVVNGKIGKLQYIYSNRLNLGAIRSEENILWSFAPHDISIIQFLVDNNPTKIFAKGLDILQNNIEDTTITYLEYPNNINAHIFVSWLHPFKEQRMVVIGEKGMYVFEDSLKTEKLKYYEKGFRINNGIIEKFENDYVPINYEEKSPLTEEQRHFFYCIEKNVSPLTDGKHALDVLRILEQATKSMKN
ncbi:MAG: Gfo/Idh/MocA family oxidoreductase [Ignavibacteriaceae bacterium]|jgi:UDP-2-acetamido-3-amino-2,3-dideoxy-glucuronate N-acetyltransferase|nr:Gfo/Idh/MocA family oxidoreductase [Ignavibacteriaceae bacterium]